MLAYYNTFELSLSTCNLMRVSFFHGKFKIILTTKRNSFDKKHIYLYFCASKN